MGLLDNRKVRLATSAAGGALLGIVVGWCTNAAMVEISINVIFALYFGFFFLFLAGVITWRVLSFAQAANRNALLLLSALMGLAGLICIIYQRHWFFTMSAAMRVPVYTIIGISLSFALSFAVAELLNYASTSGIAASSLPQRAQSALVQTPQQIVLLAAASVALGFIYGIIFGFSEIGRNVFTLHTLRSQFIHEERLCLPVGAAVGAVTGFLLEKWRPGSDEGSGGRAGGDASGAAGAGGGGGKDGPRPGLAGFGSEAAAAAGGASMRRPPPQYTDDADEEDSFDPFQGGGRRGQ